jgi:putative ABC transport system permease protein
LAERIPLIRRCANIANLLLARAAARRREIAVRLAIGAGRGRLIRQLLTESVLLSSFGFLAGIGIGYAGCRFVWSFVPAEVAGNMTSPKLDGVVLFCALAVSLATAFLFGLAPALRASKTDVVSGLKEGGATGHSRRTVSFANVLLAGQVAFSLVCLVTATLFFRSVQLDGPADGLLGHVRHGRARARLPPGLRHQQR